jgi:putative ABC transport system permease protein
MILWRLAISTFTVRKARTALTVAAVALSVSLVVTVTSGYRSMEQSALRYLNQYMGAADALVVPRDSMNGQIPERIVPQLEADPSVKIAIERLETYREMERAPDQIKPTKSADRADRVAAGFVPPDKVYVYLIGVRRPEDTKTTTLEPAEGKWFDTSTGDVAVVDQVAAEKLGVKLGEKVLVPGLKPLTLQIVGIVHKPTFFAQQNATMYLPLETLQHFTGNDNPPMITRISIDLHSGTNFDEFKQRWTAKLAATEPGAALHMRRDNAGELEKNLRGVQLLSYMGGTISIITATFIIFSALSMGISERQRVLAMLRAVGALRSQVFRLVVLEGVALSSLGVLVGIPLGIFFLILLYLRFPDFFAGGPSFSFGGMLYAAVGSILTAVAASILPAWWASRVSPLEAMSSSAPSPMARPPFGWAIVGLCAASIDPTLFCLPLDSIFQSFGAKDPPGLAQTTRFFGHFTLGAPGILMGFFLMAPLIVWICERTLAPLLATLAGVSGKLLRQQLSTGIWRSAGTAAALMVGLATLIAMQIQGHSLIGGWQLPTRFPDMFIWSSDIIGWADQQKFLTVPGIEMGSLMPVVVTTSHGDSRLQLAVAATLGQQMGVMFFGVDPDQATRLIQLDFRDNDGKPLPRDQQEAERSRVVAEMKSGRHLIITDEFRRARHLKIGDTIPLETLRNGIEPYTIAAVVWSPGADVVISMFDLARVLDQQTAGSVFGTVADAKNDFGATGARLFAANLVGGIPKEELLKNVQKALGDRGLSGGDVRQIKYAIETAFYRLLDLVSTVAIAAMAVASLGVANTVMASVRSRRWQFGVLRSIGLRREDLLRLILAEAAMLGMVGMFMGACAGIEVGFDAGRLSGVVIGYAPPMRIPWGIVAGGCFSLLVIALLASLWPAVSAARTDPLELLQAGRAST